MASIPWRDEEVSPVILGTVQLGLPYGIANEAGKPDYGRARAIVQAAWDAGCRHFDTAQAYGDSEAVLGRVFAELGISGEACVASKLAADLDCTDASAVRHAVAGSLERLGIPRLWAMLFHRAAALADWDAGVGPALLEQRAAGRIQHLGVSLNDPDEAAECLAHEAMAVYQVASNAWDRRLVHQGFFDAARRAKRLVCVRSVYLQGLLTMDAARVAERLTIARPVAERWNALAAEFGLPRVELALRYGLTLGCPLVVGAESPEQIAETLAVAARGPLAPEETVRIAETVDPLVDDVVLTPSRWPAG